MQYIIGIDPGLTGGIAAITPSGEILELKPLPDAHSFIDIFELYKTSCVDNGDMHVFLEKAQSMPSNAAQAMFNYGEGFGILQGVLLTLHVPYTLVSPVTWTKNLHMGASGDDAKAKSLQVCRRLFPKANLIAERGRKPHSGMVDALLLAEFGRRRFFNRIADDIKADGIGKVIHFQPPTCA